MVLDCYGLGPERSFQDISYNHFREVLNLYGPTMETADQYENLEDLRLNTIPEAIRQRRTGGYPYLEKAELQILGEYRRRQPPGLLNKSVARLLALNTNESVRSISMEAFTLYGDRRNYGQALEKLMKLEGVSFAMATLVLSELDSINVPYFSEGLYRWIREAEARSGLWDRKIDYTMKNYRVLLERLVHFRVRLRRESGHDVSALQVEHVARQLSEWAILRRRKRSKGDEDDFLLKPRDKASPTRLGLPLNVQDERHQTSPVYNMNGNRTSEADQSPAMARMSLSNELPSTPGTVNRSAQDRTQWSLDRLEVPIVKPNGWKSSWPGHRRIVCGTCRRQKRRCNHKTDIANAPSPRSIGRPRKHPEGVPISTSSRLRGNDISTSEISSCPNAAIAPE